jgi:hypothetical protein
MASHLGWEGRSNSSKEIHAEVVFAPAQRELLKHQIYASNCLSKNLYIPKHVQSLFSDLLIRFPVNIIQSRVLVFRLGQHAKSSDPST